MKKALVTGANGQDGYYLTQHLRSLGYEVTAGIRRPYPAPWMGDFVYFESRDFTSIDKAIRFANPDEIYNLAGQSFVPPSWDRPDETFDINVGGLARILEFVEHYNKEIKVYQASSSEMFGNAYETNDSFLNEFSRMHPTSPYGVSKLAAHRLCEVYRGKGLFVCSGICFNHESPRRGVEMVTRKITKHFAWCKVKNKIEPLKLGDTTTSRDWGFAGDYVKAMHLMLQQPEPDDFVIATGKAHTIQEFILTAEKLSGISVPIERDRKLYRSGEIGCLIGDTFKAKSQLGWVAQYELVELVDLMLKADIAEEKRHEDQQLQSM